MGIPGLLRRQGLSGELTCFTAMLTRTELMEPSIRTFSFSFLLMVTGCNRSSLLLLKTQCHRGLCTIEEQNAQEDPTAALESLRPESKEQETHSRGAPRWGPASVFSNRRSKLWSQGDKVLKSSLLCYFLWTSKLPCWNLNFLICKMTDSYFTGKD